jgi:hypothetical protein
MRSAETGFMIRLAAKSGSLLFLDSSTGCSDEDRLRALLG